LDAYFVCE